MNLPKIQKVGTTKTRKSFWDSVSELVLASQKLPGKNVSVDVRDGYGSVISTNPQRDNSQGGGIGACCYSDGTCVENTTPDGCEADGGTFQGFGTTCDPDPCQLPPCNGCGFDAFDGSGRKFLTKTIVASGNASFSPPPLCHEGDATSSWSSTKVTTIDPLDCSESCTCTGSGECDNPCSVPPCSSSMTPSCGEFSFSCGAGISYLYESTGCDWDFGGCNAGVCIACFGAACIETVVSATEMTIACDQVVSADQFGHATATITLSDECNPDGMSPPP